MPSSPKQHKGLDIDDRNRANIATDSQLNSAEDRNGIDAGDLPSKRALAEAVREHGDTFMVKTDLDDDDQRSSSPDSPDRD